MQQADAEGSMCMVRMGFDFFMSDSPAMRVEMQMAISLMFVLMRVDRECLAQRP